MDHAQRSDQSPDNALTPNRPQQKLYSMDSDSIFPASYVIARDRFRETALGSGWRLEEHGLPGSGPHGEPLAMDAAFSPGSDSGKVLIVSSGLHGIEGFFGSAVQFDLLQHWEASESRAKIILLHALNPFGFASLRRTDEHNVDLNRNFLLPGEKFEGAPAGYAALDDLLNPPSPPSSFDLFTVRALWNIARFGMPALRQAVAAGQFDYPRGLFFGGKEPSRTNQLLDGNMERWLEGASHVVHLDLHTGLGANARGKLLIDYPLTAEQRGWLLDTFTEHPVETAETREIGYATRGGFGRWCVSRDMCPHYLFACAEFGTYPPITVLAGLRAENQAHHWVDNESEVVNRTKRRLQELFCPSSPRWRSKVLVETRRLVDQALTGLSKAG